MKILLFASVLAATPWIAYSQGVVYPDRATVSATNAPSGAQTPVLTVPFARIFVCPFVPGMQCSGASTVNIYRDIALTQMISQPLVALQDGTFYFSVAPGTYNLTAFTAAGTTALYTRPITVGGSGGGGSILSVNGQVGVVSLNAASVGADPSGAASAAQVAAIAAAAASGLQKASNLADVNNSATARANIGAQQTLALTTTGTGAATLTGGALNIPVSSAGGASFPSTSAPVVNTSTTASRNATYSDIVGLFSGCGSSAPVPLYNGSCGALTATPAGTTGQVQTNNGVGGLAAVTATSANTPSTLVLRDGSGFIPTVNLPTATASAPGTLQLATGQSATQLSTVASTGKTFDILGRQTYSTPNLGKYGAYDLLRPVTFNGTGCNYGTGAGASQCGNGTNWVTWKHTIANAEFNAEGITELYNSVVNKHAPGDLASWYGYQSSPGGNPDSAEEGAGGVVQEVTTLPSYPQSVFSGTTGTGQTSVTMTATAFNALGGRVYIAKAPVVDKSVNRGTGTYTGSPTPVVAGAAVLYWKQPVSETLSVSVAGRLVSCTGSPSQIPATSAPQNQVYQTDTCVWTNNETASGAGFSTGIATIFGPFPEQVQITAVASAGTNQQSVTFSHRNSNAVGYTTLWQGGTQGTVQTTDYQESLPATGQVVGFPVVTIVAGSFDSHTLVTGEIHAGLVDVPPYQYHAPFALNSLTRTGSTVTATASQILGQDPTFNNMAAAVLAGCSDSSMNGTVTNLTETAAGVFTFTSPNSGSTSCASATLNLTTAQLTHHLYPYANQIVADNFVSTGNDASDNAILNAARAQTLETNGMTLTNGDVMFQPLFSTFDGHVFWSKSTISTPYGRNRFLPLEITQNGNGASGQNTAIRVTRNLPINTLIGGGGLNPPALMTEMLGPNIGNNLELPMNGYPIWNLYCPTADPNCNVPISLLHFQGTSVNMSTGTVVPATGAWTLPSLFTPTLTATSSYFNATNSGTGNTQNNHSSLNAFMGNPNVASGYKIRSVPYQNTADPQAAASTGNDVGNFDCFVDGSSVNHCGLFVYNGTTGGTPSLAMDAKYNGTTTTVAFPVVTGTSFNGVPLTSTGLASNCLTAAGTYVACGSGGGSSAITGLRYGNGSSADTVATPAQVQAASTDPTVNSVAVFKQASGGADAGLLTPTAGQDGLEFVAGHLNLVKGTASPSQICTADGTNCPASGNTTSTSLTSGTIPKASGANAIVNSLLTDNGTTLSYSGTGGIASTGTSPMVMSNTASNTDMNGLLTMSSGTISRTFTGTYTSAPVCVASDTSSIAAVRVVTTTTTLTITGTGSDGVAYLCMGRN